MDPDFWHARWANNQIGFHEGRPNEYLTRFVGRLGVRHGACIFVPMCGKGVDMLWLADQGYRVLGVEISPVAVQAFFDESEMVAQQTAAGPFTHWKYGPIEILCGDFFALTAADLSEVAAVYDRAALIALPEDLRNAYVRHLEATLPRARKHLLVTLDYSQEQMSGPPFSVDAAEVYRLFPEPCAIEPLASRDVLKDNPHLTEKGVTRLRENAFLLSRC